MCIDPSGGSRDNNDNGGLLYAANLPVRKTQCASTHHSRKYTRRHKHNVHLPPPPHTHTHIMVRLDLWKSLFKKESFQLDFEVREGGEITTISTLCCIQLYIPHHHHHPPSLPSSLCINKGWNRITSIPHLHGPIIWFFLHFRS